MITVLSVLIVLNQLVNYYFYGKGDLTISYPLTMLSMLGYMVVETLLAFNDPSQRAIFLFNFVNLYGFINAFKGYRRLRDERKAELLLRTSGSNEEVQPKAAE